MAANPVATRRRGYHHGNLKEALIRAALALIAEKGPAGFTFAEAARWAGVSPAAPYRHFRDRDELLADVARQGFVRFEQALSRAWDDGRPEPFVAFDRIGKAYLVSRAPSLRITRRCSRSPCRSTPIRSFARLAIGRSTCSAQATERLIATMPPRQRPPVMMMALHVWALSHGIASLFGRGDAASRKLPMQPEELLEAGVLLYLRGLGLPEA